MKPIDVPITCKDKANSIPKDVPVNWEFTFCEQFAHNLLDAIVSQDAPNISTDLFTRSLKALKRQLNSARRSP